MNKATEATMSIQLSMTPVEEISLRAKRFPARKKPARFTIASVLRPIGMGVLILALSVGAYFAISHFLLESVQIVGESMVPTLHENGHYLLNRWTLRDRNPQNRDVVVLRDPADHGFSVKRIIAKEGESVHFKNGKVYVNGKELSEPYLSPGTLTFTYSAKHEQFIMCGKDQYFVLGDNRFKSIDSRYYGPVPRQNILGLIVLH